MKTGSGCEQRCCCRDSFLKMRWQPNGNWMEFFELKERKYKEIAAPETWLMGFIYSAALFQTFCADRFTDGYAEFHRIDILNIYWSSILMFHVWSWQSLLTFIRPAPRLRSAWTGEVLFWPSTSSEIYGLISSLFRPPLSLRALIVLSLKPATKWDNSSPTSLPLGAKQVWSAFKAELTKSNIKSGSAENTSDENPIQ